MHGAMGYPHDGASNENMFLKSCAFDPWGFVVESARRYKCGQVQSAQEYIMYLDTDERACDIAYCKSITV